MRLLDAETDFGQNADGVFREYTQPITPELLDTLKSERLAKSELRSRDMDRCASVPTFVWELWMRQGRDPNNATGRQIVAWLAQDDLHAFITTPKRV